MACCTCNSEYSLIRSEHQAALNWECFFSSTLILPVHCGVSSHEGGFCEAAACPWRAEEHQGLDIFRMFAEKQSQFQGSASLGTGKSSMRKVLSMCSEDPVISHTGMFTISSATASLRPLSCTASCLSMAPLLSTTRCSSPWELDYLVKQVWRENNHR